jgi:TPR repeat protein
VGTDFEKASKWFRKSADQGHAQAQYALGIIFSGGRMGAVDVAEGYVWFCLAEKSGFAIAAEDCKILEDELSPEELAAAQTRMNELLAETLQVKD